MEIKLEIHIESHQVKNIKKNFTCLTTRKTRSLRKRKFLTSLFYMNISSKRRKKMQKSAILSNPSYIKLFYTLHSIGSFTFFLRTEEKKDEETTENVVILREKQGDKRVKRNERIYEKWEWAASVICSCSGAQFFIFVFLEPRSVQYEMCFFSFS